MKDNENQSNRLCAGAAIEPVFFRALFPDFQSRNGNPSRSFIYGEVRAGRLKVTKFGRRTYVHRDDELAWQNSLRAGRTRFARVEPDERPPRTRQTRRLAKLGERVLSIPARRRAT